MPFGFLKRGKDDRSAAGPRREPGVPGPIRFDVFTEEWRLRGVMHGDGRLTDLLNQRDAIPISDVSWAPLDGSRGFEPAPGIKSIDPYELIIVLADRASLPERSEEERAARRVHKVSYDVALEAPPYRVIGTVQLHPGTEPSRLLDRGSEMFVPVVDATLVRDGVEVPESRADAVLVNRSYLRDVGQVDKRTGQSAQSLPGSTLGGVSWQNRDR